MANNWNTFFAVSVWLRVETLCLCSVPQSFVRSVSSVFKIKLKESVTVQLQNWKSDGRKKEREIQRESGQRVRELERERERGVPFKRTE